MNKEKIINIINNIQINLNEIIKEIKSSPESQSGGGAIVNQIPIVQKETEPKVVTETKKPVVSGNPEFEQLKNLLNSPEWPEAVSDFQIVDENSEEEKMDRAEGIVDILVQEDLSNKKFLDFGCGEGHMAKYASKQALISVGYDIVRSSKSKLNWEQKEENFLLTTDFEKIKEQGPFDIITIYDVLDHAEGDPKEILEKAKSVLSENGKIYLRCHPWCGRHGGHLYRQINKAFVHLIFTEEELNSMGYKLEEKNIKVLFPIRQYGEIIEKSGLKTTTKEPEVEKQRHEDVFEKNPIISKRIKNLINVGGGFPSFQIAQSFLDYVLTR